MESTTRFEAEVARRHTPDIAWPTIALLAGCLCLWLLSSALALAEVLPLWLAMVLNTLALYAIYTTVHDASHSAVVPRNKRLRWVNTVVGTLALAGVFFLVVTPLGLVARLSGRDRLGLARPPAGRSLWQPLPAVAHDPERQF